MKNFTQVLKSEKLIGIILPILFFILYLLTLAPSVTFIDSGELAAACCTLGIAHPTGYPLFTLLGYIFSKIPFINSEIYKLNMMSAVFCALSLFFLFKIVVLILNQPLNRISKKQDGKKKSSKNIDGTKSIPGEIILISSAATVLSLGLSKNFWDQATAIEVYSLHCLFISLLIFTFLKNIFVSTNLSIKNKKYFAYEKGWLIFGFVLGLSFTNHMSTIFLIPAFAFFYFQKYRFNKDSFIRIFLMIIPFLAGLALYLYFPIRASQIPEINWGNPFNLERMIWHITGKQYSTWVFTSMDDSIKQMKYFLELVPKDFLCFSIISAFFGVTYLFKRNRNIFYFTFIAFITCTLLAVNYNINDIDSYFLLSYFIISIWAGIGILWISEYLLKNFRNLRIQNMWILLIIPFIQILNYNSANRSENFLVEDYTMNVFNSVKENGIVLSFQWDNWVSASYYYQHVKGIRKDITVIDKELLRRSWYFIQLEKNYPWLIEKSRNEVNEFLVELRKFEYNIPYNPVVIQSKFVNMINSFIDKNIEQRPIYLGDELEREVGAKFMRVPEGLLHRLYSDNIYHDYSIVDYKIRLYRKKDKYIDQLLQFYGAMFTKRASYEMFFGQNDKAMWYINKALEIVPGYSPALSLKRQIERK